MAISGSALPTVSTVFIVARSLPTPPPTVSPMTSFVPSSSMRMAPSGSAPVAASPHLTLNSALHVDTFTQSAGLGSDLVGAMARDTNGNLWVATLAGLFRLSGGTRPAIKNSPQPTDFRPASSHLCCRSPRAQCSSAPRTTAGWLGMARSSPSPSQVAARSISIYAILDDDHSNLWFATGDGIARCSLNAATSGSHMADCGPWLTFGPADGLRSREMATNSHPSAWRSHDGLLWFATPKGLVQVDPAHFPVNTVPPPVSPCSLCR